MSRIRTTAGLAYWMGIYIKAITTHAENLNDLVLTEEQRSAIHQAICLLEECQRLLAKP